jgi:4-amino-4-deoxy-L-arabinose transferase-like glycosyltransferase
MATGAAVLAAWVVPYAAVMGWSEVRSVWFGDPAVTLQALPLDRFLVHLVTYPLEIAVGTLPWSLMLLPYLFPSFRRAIGPARDHVIFLALYMAVAFASCWLKPGGALPRYFAPLYPAMAVLIGLAIQRCTEAMAVHSLRAAWRRFAGAMAWSACGLGIVVVTATAWRMVTSRPVPWAETPLMAAVYGAVAASLCVLLFRVREQVTDSRARLAVVGLSSFLALTFSGVVLNIRLRRSENPAEAMAKVKAQLPPGERLVSLGGHIDALFPFYYGLPLIEARPIPAANHEPDWTYFCVTCIPGDSRPQLPFAWEEVGTIPLDRIRHPIPQRAIVVGRRVSQQRSANVTPARE